MHLTQLKQKKALYLYQVWKRYKLRKYCLEIQLIGKEKRLEILQQEEIERELFRLRIAKRQIDEYQQFKQWKGTKLTSHNLQPSYFSSFQIDPKESIKQWNQNSPNKLTKAKYSTSSSLDHSISPRFEAMKQQSLQQTQQPPQPMLQRFMPLYACQETIDTQIFSSDDSRLRPDLAPFSTMINEMILSSINLDPTFPVPRSVSLDPQIKDTSGFVSTSGLRTRLNSEHKSNIPTPPVLSKSNTAKGPNELRITSSYDDGQWYKWEEQARVDDIPTIASLRQAKRYKSPAYRALEKLCGLTEDDILKSLRKEKPKINPSLSIDESLTLPSSSTISPS